MRDDLAVGGGETVDGVTAAGGVRDAGRGEKQAKDIGGQVPLAALIFLPASMPWLAGGTLLLVFTLCESMITAVGQDHAGAVDLQDRIDDLPQVMHGLTDTQAGRPLDGPPGNHGGFDQRSPRIGQVGTARAVTHRSS